MNFKSEYKMTFTTEQLNTLSAWEEHLRTAVNKQWARNPGRSALKQIYDIYTKATGDRRRFSDNCGNCILSLLSDCGKVYFRDKEEMARREVKVAPEAAEPVAKVKVATKGKGKKK